MVRFTRWQKDLVLCGTISGAVVLLLLWPYFENPEVLRHTKYRYVLMFFSTLALPILDKVYSTFPFENLNAFVAVGAMITWTVNTLALFFLASVSRLVARRILSRTRSDSSNRSG